MIVSMKKIEDARQNLIKLREVKNYLKIDNEVEDSLLIDLILAATRDCEEWSGIMISKTKISVIYKQNDKNKYYFVLPKKPVIKIVNIYGFYDNGVKSIINENYYYLLIDKVILRQKFNFNNININFEVGYTNEIPENLKITIFEHISDMYEKRSVCSNFLAEKYKKYRNIKLW